MDRNELEQEAMRQLNLGSLEGALRAYQRILRMEPRDRRIRQKLGDLMLKMGRPADAERYFREVVDGLVKEGAHRAAVAVLKQLVTLRPDDATLQMDLAECYVASGYANDARPHFETAMRFWINAGRTLDAARAARRIADQSPGEPPLRLKLAELLEAGGDPDGAARSYQQVADEYRRRGRPDEVGRIAEMALRLKPDDMGLLLDAAAARVEANDYKRALVHLGLAYGQAPKNRRTLELLSRAYEAVGQPEKALKVLVDLAGVAAEAADPVAEADALRRAARLAPGDVELHQRFEAAQEKVSRSERRLTHLTLAEPATEDQLRAQVRAEVYLRYGFLDRAESALGDALTREPDALGLLAAMAELEAMRERPARALLLMERLLLRAGPEVDAVEDRIAVVRARWGLPPPVVVVPAVVAAVTPVVVDDDAFSDFVPLEDGVYAEVIPEDSEDFGDFGDFEDFGNEAPPLDHARALLADSSWADTIASLVGVDTLEAAVLRARAVSGQGDSAGAIEVLRETVSYAQESDPAYPEALFELSALYVATGKVVPAMRLLEQLKDFDPGYRKPEVDERMRELQKLIG